MRPFIGFSYTDATITTPLSAIMADDIESAHRAIKLDAVNAGFDVDTIHTVVYEALQSDHNNYWKTTTTYDI